MGYGLRLDDTNKQSPQRNFARRLCSKSSQQRYTGSGIGSTGIFFPLLEPFNFGLVVHRFHAYIDSQA